MIDRAINVNGRLTEVIIVRRRNRIWRIIQFAIAGAVTVIALLNVFVWQYVIRAVGTAATIFIGFLYFVTFLECFNYYHFECPLCGMEHKTSDFEIFFKRRCDNCHQEFKITFVNLE